MHNELDLKALEAFHSGREYHHVKYVKNRKRQRNYLILLKKDPLMEIQLCGQALIMLLYLKLICFIGKQTPGAFYPRNLPAKFIRDQPNSF